MLLEMKGVFVVRNLYDVIATSAALKAETGILISRKNIHKNCVKILKTETENFWLKQTTRFRKTQILRLRNTFFL